MERRSREGRDAPSGAEPSLGEITIRGRTFTSQELSAIRALVEASPDDHRFALSKRVCRALGWVQPNGRLKDRSCRDVLAKLHAIGSTLR